MPRNLSDNTFVFAPVPQLFRDRILVTAAMTIACSLALLQPMLGLAAVGVILLGLAIELRPRTALLIFVFMVPFDLQLQFGSGRPAYLDLAYAAFALPLFRRFIAGKHLSWPLLAYLAFLGYAVLSCLGRSENPTWLGAATLRFVIMIVFATAVWSFGDTEEIVLTLGAGLIPLVAYGFYQLAIGERGALYPYLSGTAISGQYEPEWMNRAYSFLPHPNSFGSYASALAVMLFAVALRTGNLRRARAAFLLGSVGIVGVLTSGSRGALIGGVIGLAITAAFTRLHWRTVLIFVGAALAIAMVTTVTGMLPVERMLGSDEFTKVTRFQLWGMAAAMFVGSPLTGVGWMNFPALMTDTFDWDLGAAHAHNWYLHTLAETGLIGFVLYFAPLAYLLWRSLRAARTSTAALVAAAGLGALLVQGVFDVLNYDPQRALLFAVLLGLAAQVRASDVDEIQPEAA